MLKPNPAAAGIAQVGTPVTNSALGSATLTLTKTLTGGNEAIVGIGWSSSAVSLTSVNGSVNGAYTLVNCFSESFGALTRICLYHHANVTGGSETVTVTLASAATGTFYGAIAEFSGVSTSSALDNAGAGAQQNGVTNPSTTATAAGASELFIGWIGGNATASVGSGFTEIVGGSTGDTYGFYEMQYKITAGSGTQTSTWSTGTNYYWMLAASFNHQ